MALTASQRIDAAAPIAEAMLPPNATPVAKALLAAELAAFAAVDPMVIATIWDPWRCPTALLRWLAWSVSVDFWDVNWSEIDQRREIAASPEIHRHKGTRTAVEAALNRMSLNYDLSEWWETTPTRRRGTFKAFIDAQDLNTLDVRSEASIRLHAAKAKSRVLELRVGVQEVGPVGVAAGTLTKSTIISEPFIQVGPVDEIGLMGISSGTVTRSIITAEAA